MDHGTSNLQPQQPTLPWATCHRRARPTQGTTLVPNFLQLYKTYSTTCPRLSRRSFRTKRLIFNKGLLKDQSQGFELETGQNQRFDKAATLLGVSTNLSPAFEKTANLWATRYFWIGKNWETISHSWGPSNSGNKDKLCFKSPQGRSHWL